MFRCLHYPFLCLALIIGTPQQIFADAKQNATEILKQTGVSGGFVVHLGVGTGELTAALRQGTESKYKD